MSKQLRAEWFSANFWESEKFLAACAGIDPGDLDLSAVEALGAFKQVDPIVTDVYNAHCEIVKQWFLIGFVLGQEPSRVLLQPEP